MPEQYISYKVVLGSVNVDVVLNKNKHFIISGCIVPKKSIGVRGVNSQKTDTEKEKK
jgi:hypothetical protein